MNEEFSKFSDAIQHPKNGPFIIAEMSGNHNQSLSKALEIVEIGRAHV